MAASAVGLAVLAAGVVAGPAPAGATSGVTTGLYHRVTPKRVLDTRTQTPVAAHATRTVVVTGADVPAGATSVVLTVTVTRPARLGYLTVYPAGGTLPLASNLNFVAHATVPNLVVTRIGAGGAVAIYNGSDGSSDVVVDVSGYYADATTATGQGGYDALPTTRRALDTRSTHSVAAHGSVSFAATGVPAGASAAVVNLTATSPTSVGFLAAYAEGTTRPTVSNVNFVRGQTVANLAVVPLSSAGRITVYNGAAGTVQVVADVTGYLGQGAPVNAGAFGALTPSRLLDTRTSRAVPAHGTITVATAGHDGVPAARVGNVVMNLTALGGASPGYLTVWANGTTRPTVSNANFDARQTSAVLVVAAADSQGRVSIYNGSSSPANVVIDVSGFIPSADAPLPNATSVSRYVRALTASFTDASSNGEGCADARAGSTLVLLDIGAQLTDRTGVELTVVNTKVTYAQLVAAVNNYLTSFAACATGGGATIAVGTNNDGDFTAYPAAARGADWAIKVVGALDVPPGLTVAGANDIEGGFSSTEAQAEQWETAYLANTGNELIFNGSADGCPGTWGANATCAYGWTQANYYTLAGGTNARIRSLPQVYLPYQAVQWTNIDRVGGGRIHWAGALTESNACGSAGCNFAALPPTQGWAALYDALTTITSSIPLVPAVTDLRIDE